MLLPISRSLDEVLKMFSCSSVVDALATSRLRWFGHTERREDHEWIKKIRDRDGMQRQTGRPRIRWMDNVEQDMREKLIIPELAQDRPAWRSIIQARPA